MAAWSVVLMDIESVFAKCEERVARSDYVVVFLCTP